MGCWILEKYRKASVHQPVMVMSYTKFGDGKIISLLTLDYLMKRQGHLAGTIYHEENPMGIQLSPWNREITGTNATHCYTRVFHGKVCLPLLVWG